MQHPERGDRRRFGGWPRLLLGCLLCAVGAGFAAPAPALQGFVSVALLTHWCRTPAPLETESCLSYLRGVFDAAAAAADAGALGEAMRACPAPTVPITELAAMVRARRPAPGADRIHQAGAMVLALMHRRFPCVPPEARAPARARARH